MNYTDVQSGDMVTRTYENGAIVEFASIEHPITPIPQPIQPSNQEINDNLLTIIDIQLTTYEDMLAKGTV